MASKNGGKNLLTRRVVFAPSRKKVLTSRSKREGLFLPEERGNQVPNLGWLTKTTRKSLSYARCVRWEGRFGSRLKRKTWGGLTKTGGGNYEGGGYYYQTAEVGRSAEELESANVGNSWKKGCTRMELGVWRTSPFDVSSKLSPKVEKELSIGGKGAIQKGCSRL